MSDSTARERGAILVVADGTVLMELCCMLQGSPLGPGWERPPRDEGLELVVHGSPMRLYAARSCGEAVDRARRIGRAGRRLTVAFVATHLADAPGVEVISQIRAIDPRVLFVAVSSNLDREEVVELGSLFCEAADDWDLLSRPFSGELVRQKAQHMVASWHRRRLHEMELSVRREQEIQAASELAAGVAHEINNPIAFVQSNLYSLARYVRKIESYAREVRRGESVVSRIEDPEVRGFFEQIQKLREELKLDLVLDDLEQLVQQSLRGTSRVQQVVRLLRAGVAPGSGLRVIRKIGVNR